MKVVKFGGSSMADANQYRKVRDILLADPERRVVVVSAAGKRNSQDHKITDLLYLCHAHTQYGVDCSNIFEMTLTISLSSSTISIVCCSILCLSNSYASFLIFMILS